MKARFLVLMGTLLAGGLGGASAQEAVSPPELAQQGYAVLKTYCARCHGESFAVQGLDVLHRESLLGGEYLKPGDLDGSALWQRVAVDGDMPPDGEPRPTEQELDVLRRWIEAGAPYPALEQRQFVSTEQTLIALRGFLRQAEPRDRRFLRFFTLTNLNNNAANVTADEYRLYQAALSKALNSLSREPRIVRPKRIDEAGTVFAIDLRDYGWDRDGLWQEVLKRYPYGLLHDGASDAELRAAADEVYELSGTDLPAVRADWFIATATRPPLYHTLLRIPETAAELEDELQVDVEGDFRRDRLARAGFATSGVSGQNRLVDRHDAAHGAYWTSYDFKSNRGRGDLFRFPLGPEFEDHPFAAQAFRHDGGEIIFSLPNGLHGYMLVDGQGGRIDAGPEEVVSDRLKTSGTPAIVTGLSCMACHKSGMLPLKDTVRAGVGVFGAAREKVDALFPEPEEMDALLARDEAQYMRALEQAVGPILQVGADREKDLRTFPEPIGAIARRYQQDLGPAEVAAELGIEDPATLQMLVKNSSRLKALGLGPLAAGEKIKREAWDSLDRQLSTFHFTALELDLGSPKRIWSD